MHFYIGPTVWGAEFMYLTLVPLSHSSWAQAIIAELDAEVTQQIIQPTTLHRRQADALIPMAGDAHTGVSQTVQKLVQEVVSWQKRNNTQVIPKKYGDDEEQRNLGMRFAKLLLRRDKSLGTSQSRVQLSHDEAALVNSVSGVPATGCSALARQWLI